MVRISGLASGMDVDELVSSLMKAARVPLDTLTQKKTYSEWQRDDYRDMNKSLLELDTLISNGISKQASYIKKTVTVSDSNAISVKNLSSTSDFSGTIEVQKLATAATMKNKGLMGITDPTAKLTDYAGETLSISAINADGKLGDPVKITIGEDDTLNTIITKINSTAGVTAFYDTNSKQISFTAKNQGDVKDTAEIVFLSTKADGTTEGSFFSEGLNVDSDNIEAGSYGTQGQNAKLKYNGLEIERSSNTFQINGVQITLKQAATGPVTFSSKADVDSILETVTTFVTKYNELIEKVKEKTDEKKYRDYQPLTAEQKKEMSDSEIELWEKKAKSGTLRNDSILNGVLTKMRSSMYMKVSGVSEDYDQLSEIGITTTSNYLEGGKLTINEDKLREAISADPDSIYKLFMADGETINDQGIARRLRANLKTAMSEVTEKAGNTGSKSVNNTFTIGKLLDNYDKKIDSLQDRLKALETRYYKQFTAMETAISKANSQSTSLSSYFSS